MISVNKFLIWKVGYYIVIVAVWMDVHVFLYHCEHHQLNLFNGNLTDSVSGDFS